MARGEVVVQGFDAWWEGVHVYGLGDVFVLEGGFLGGKLVFESFNGALDFGGEVGDFGVEFGFYVFADFFLEEAGDFVVGDGNVAMGELAVDEFPLGVLEAGGVLEVVDEMEDVGVNGGVGGGLDVPLEELGDFEDCSRLL